MPAPATRRRLRGRLAPGAWALLASALTALSGAPRALAEERVRVRAGDGVLDLRLEDYVAGVVSGEMPASFPPEALKAQAVAARSYALTRKIEAQAAARTRATPMSASKRWKAALSRGSVFQRSPSTVPSQASPRHHGYDPTNV